jgi:hypothetical protein
VQTVSFRVARLTEISSPQGNKQMLMALRLRKRSTDERLLCRGETQECYVGRMNTVALKRASYLAKQQHFSS